MEELELLRRQVTVRLFFSTRCLDSVEGHVADYDNRFLVFGVLVPPHWRREARAISSRS